MGKKLYSPVRESKNGLLPARRSQKARAEDYNSISVLNLWIFMDWKFWHSGRSLSPSGTHAGLAHLTVGIKQKSQTV